MTLQLRLALAAAALAIVVGAYQTGVNAERARGEAAELRQRLATIEADRTNAERAAATANRQAAELADLNRQQQEALDALETELRGRPDADRQRADRAALDRLYPRRP